MVPDWIITYVGGGILIVVAYVIVSNTFWLLFGSTLLTKLPGVNQQGAKGTLKIALLILLSIFGFFRWLLSFPFRLFYKKADRWRLKDYISQSIQTASRWHEQITNRNPKHEE